MHLILAEFKIFMQNQNFLRLIIHTKQHVTLKFRVFGNSAYLDSLIMLHTKQHVALKFRVFGNSSYLEYLGMSYCPGF